MKLVFHASAWEDCLHWQANDPKLLLRLNDLLRECQRLPLSGTGKPEPLRGNLRGWWSRRIDREHRLVYRVSGNGDGDAQALEIAQCRYHY